MDDLVRKELWDEYLRLAKKFCKRASAEEFGEALIEFTTKMLMDTQTSRKKALDTINIAVKDGIWWHLEHVKTKGEKCQ